MAFRQYKGPRRETDDPGVSDRVGGRTSPGTMYPGSGAPALQPGNGEGARAGSGINQRPMNAEVTTFNYYTKTESDQVLPRNPKRVYLAIQNRGTNNVFLAFAQRADTDAFRIEAGGFYEPYICPRTSVNLRGAVAGENIVIIEGFEPGD